MHQKQRFCLVVLLRLNILQQNDREATLLTDFWLSVLKNPFIIKMLKKKNP